MCGIVGIHSGEGRVVDRELVIRMCRMLSHRGPDQEGIFVEGCVGLGHRRLVVIDPVTGNQPMSNEDGSLTIVSNSEIYNYKELRNELEKLGHRFSTRSDTEVILHLYEEKGTSCVRYLRGMFAFGLWDSTQKRLFLARDRLGKKPLYYYHGQGLFLFASMPGPILIHPEVKTSLSASALDCYLSLLYIPGPATIFSSVKKLEPAHTLVYEKGCILMDRYWHLQYSPKFKGSPEEVEAGLMETLREAVRIRLRSDVPVGSFLSGGIDSSIVTALMAMEHGTAPKVFSIGFSEPGFDEVPYARSVARHLDLEHHAVWVGPEDLCRFPDIVVRMPEPLADPSIVPTYFLAKLARGHVTVALSGDGGDECFAGYDRYLYARLAHAIRTRAPLVASGMSRILAAGSRCGSRGRANERMLHNRLHKFLDLVALPLDRSHLSQFDQMARLSRRELYTKEVCSLLDSESAGVKYFERVFASIMEMDHYLDRLLSADITSYLAWDILVKLDTASMAHSLEVRSPMLDHHLVEYVARLGPEYKLKGLTRKYLLRRLGRRVLPRAVSRRRKQGFSLPLSLWLRTEAARFAEEILFQGSRLTEWLFNKHAVVRLWKEHTASERDHGYLLWAMIVLECWYASHRFYPTRLDV